MKCELKCSKCDFIAVVKVESIDPNMFRDDCPKCGAELEKGYDI